MKNHFKNPAADTSSDRTVNEGFSGHGVSLMASPEAGVPDAQFHGWVIRQPLATEGAEADVFLISQGAEQ